MAQNPKVVYEKLACSVAAQVATLTAPLAVEPSHMALAGGGIVVNLTANVADIFETIGFYKVTIEKVS